MEKGGDLSLTASCLPIHCWTSETQNIGHTLGDEDQDDGGDVEDDLAEAEEAEDEGEDEAEDEGEDDLAEDEEAEDGGEDEGEDEGGANRRLDAGYKILERKACS